jgi:preprotein translocase subunit SecG
MVTALYILHVIVCLAMLPIILLQSGKGGGVSAVFGGGGAGTVFGSRGAATFLTKMTSAAAIIFMCTSMGLSYFSSRSRSVVSDVPKPVPVEAPAAGADGEGQVGAPTSTGGAATP